MRIRFKNQTYSFLTTRLTFNNTPEAAGLSEQGPSSPESSFEQEKQKVLNFLDKLDSADPKAKSATALARKKVEQISSSKETAKKAGNLGEISKLIVELQNTLKPFENLFLAAELQKSKGLERASLKKIVEDKDRNGKIFPKGYNYLFNNALFVSEDLKSFTLLNAVSNDIKLTDTKVHSISDINGKTRNYIQVSIGGGKPGYIEEAYFDYSLLPLPPKPTSADKSPGISPQLAKIIDEIEAKEALLAPIKVLPPKDGSEDLEFEKLLLRGSEAEYQSFKKFKLDQINTTLDELYKERAGQVDVKGFLKELKDTGLFTCTRYKAEKTSPWAENLHDLGSSMEIKAEEWFNKNGSKETAKIGKASLGSLMKKT